LLCSELDNFPSGEFGGAALTQSKGRERGSKDGEGGNRVGSEERIEDRTFQGDLAAGAEG